MLSNGYRNRWLWWFLQPMKVFCILIVIIFNASGNLYTIWFSISGCIQCSLLDDEKKHLRVQVFGLLVAECVFDCLVFFCVFRSISICLFLSCLSLLIRSFVLALHTKHVLSEEQLSSQPRGNQGTCYFAGSTAVAAAFARNVNDSMSIALSWERHQKCLLYSYWYFPHLGFSSFRK